MFIQVPVKNVSSGNLTNEKGEYEDLEVLHDWHAELQQDVDQVDLGLLVLLDMVHHLGE